MAVPLLTPSNIDEHTNYQTTYLLSKNYVYIELSYYRQSLT